FALLQCRLQLPDVCSPEDSFPLIVVSIWRTIARKELVIKDKPTMTKSCWRCPTSVHASEKASLIRITTKAKRMAADCGREKATVRTTKNVALNALWDSEPVASTTRYSRKEIAPKAAATEML